MLIFSQGCLARAGAAVAAADGFLNNCQPPGTAAVRSGVSCWPTAVTRDVLVDHECVRAGGQSLDR